MLDCDVSLPLAAAPAPGFLERLPKWLICVPLVIQWLWLSLRYGHAALPSTANPAITSGGLVGEGKTEYFASMGPIASAATAAYASFVVKPARALQDAARCLQDAALDYPIIAKPDIGWCGFGVRRIDSAQALADYLAAFPAGARLLLQAYVAHAGEAGVFYVREPGAPTGRITGLALRQFPQVVGDGLHTIAELIAADARLRRLGRDGLHQLAYAAAEIPEAGRAVRLATIGSTRVGGLYRNGEALITPALTAAIDAIAQDMRDFHFGRFDLRFESAALLREGRGFRIIEVNGAGSEAIEAWDPALSPLAAFRRIFAKQALLFRIGAMNRARGHLPIALRELARLHLAQQRLIPLYPPSN
ncbi:MAG: hypothetical protein NVS9B10_11350 [Nevskia sp.]